MDLSRYRLTDLSQLDPFKEQMGEKQYYEYAFSVYRQLARLEPGNKFSITKYVKEKNMDLFVKIVCMYMIDFPGQVVFNDDFTEITKNADIRKG